jgi:hypothetical protein
MKRITKMWAIILLWITISCNLWGQPSGLDSLKTYFNRQLATYPQEKIYLHTDKPYYVSGERIWFRAHLTDAVLHRPAIASRYVYVELIDPADVVIRRIKIRQDEQIYSGYMFIPEELPEGDYTLRAYTHYMRSMGGEYFFRKTVHIGNLQSRLIHTDVKFEFSSNKKMTAIIRFSHTRQSGFLTPESVRVKINTGDFMLLKEAGDGTYRVGFSLPDDARSRVLLAEAVKDGISFMQYVAIPVPDDGFDVSFFPEGGDLLPGVLQKIAFKAMKSDGVSVPVVGSIYDNTGKENHPHGNTTPRHGLCEFYTGIGKELPCLVRLRTPLPRPLSKGEGRVYL